MTRNSADNSPLRCGSGTATGAPKSAIREDCQLLPTMSKTAKKRYSPECQPITTREFPVQNGPANHLPTAYQLLPTALPTAVPTVFHRRLGNWPSTAARLELPIRSMGVPRTSGTSGTASEAEKNPRR
jgi:hypothetical protein